MDKKELIYGILQDAPTFHRIGRKEIIMHPGKEAMEFIAENTLKGDITIETGCGYTTVVFIACGANHTVIVPDQEQIDKVKSYVARKRFNDSNVQYICESSDIYLPRLSKTLGNDRSFDFVYIDGQHAFPFPVIDWAYTEKHVKLGGIIGIDNVEIPSVTILSDFMNIDWNYLEVKKANLSKFYRVGRVDKGYEGWGQQPFNTFPQYLQKLSIIKPSLKIQKKRTIFSKFIDYLKNIANKQSKQF